MNRAFYPRLAAQSGIKNGKFTFPYLLTVIGSAAAFYIMLALNFTGELPEMIRYQYLSQFFTIGIFVMALFTLVFLFYTNSFLIKRRKKELGLYNVLGMGKGNIALILSFETLYTWLLGVSGGVLLGMLLQKLVTMLVQRVTHVEDVFVFHLSARAILWTAAFFGLVLLLTLGKTSWACGCRSPWSCCGEKTPGNGSRGPNGCW